MTRRTPGKCSPVGWRTTTENDPTRASEVSRLASSHFECVQVRFVHDGQLRDFAHPYVMTVLRAEAGSCVSRTICYIVRFIGKWRPRNFSCATDGASWVAERIEGKSVKVWRIVQAPALFERGKSLGVLVVWLATLAAWQAGHAAQEPRVAVEVVRQMPLLSRLELSGTVTARRLSQLSAEVPGSVAAVHHDAGAEVAAGDVLVELDRRLEEIAREQTVAQIADAEAQLADAHRRLGIAEDLAKRSHGPQNAVDTIKTEIAVRRAAVERLKAERLASEERLIRHQIKAPFSGAISRKLTEVGQWVVPGTSVAELVELEGLRIDLPVPQQYYTRIKEGVDISLAFDALPEATFPARVDAIVPVSDPNARTFTLRVVPLNAGIEIAPGMSARATISLRTGAEGLVVSRDALLRQPDGRITAWVVEPNGDGHLVRERRVEIGLSFDGMTEIRSGLKLGDRVVVRGNEALSEGQTVELAS